MSDYAFSCTLAAAVFVFNSTTTFFPARNYEQSAARPALRRQNVVQETRLYDRRASHAGSGDWRKCSGFQPGEFDPSSTGPLQTSRTDLHNLGNHTEVPRSVSITSCFGSSLRRVA